MDKKRCIIGRDDDNGIGGLIGCLFAISAIIAVTICAIFIMCSVGAIVGAFTALKNYFASLKYNIIDTNRKPKNA